MESIDTKKKLRFAEEIERLTEMQSKMTITRTDKNAKTRSNSQSSFQNNEKNIVEFVINKHVDLNHSKLILKELEKDGIVLDEEELRQILSKCALCNEYTESLYNQIIRHQNCTGGLMGLGIVPFEDYYFVMLIDYFSRKVFLQYLPTKNSISIGVFLARIFSRFNFRHVIAPPRKCLKNASVVNWMAKNDVVCYFTPTWEYRGLGRLGRCVRTLKGILEQRENVKVAARVEKTEKIYNRRHNEGVAMSPNLASLACNKKDVFEHQKKRKQRKT